MVICHSFSIVFAFLFLEQDYFYHELFHNQLMNVIQKGNMKEQNKELGWITPCSLLYLLFSQSSPSHRPEKTSAV